MWHTKHSSALHLSFLLRVVEFSFVLWFPEKQARSCLQALQDIALVMCQDDTNTRIFSFTFIICPSIISHNTIDLLKRERERVCVCEGGAADNYAFLVARFWHQLDSSIWRNKTCLLHTSYIHYRGGKSPPQKKGCPVNDTKRYLMFRIQFCG